MEVALVATEAMVATDPLVGMSMPTTFGMEPMATVAVGGLEVAGLEMAAAAGSRSSSSRGPHIPDDVDKSRHMHNT